MKEKLNVLQVALFAVNCDNSDEGVLAASNAINDFTDQEKQALKEKIIKLVETRKSEVPIGQSYWRACGNILNMINKL